MIVVVGQPMLERRDGQTRPAGIAAEIARAGAGRGARVELVGKAGEDPDGDTLMLALARAGIGHVALLRDATRTTPRLVEPADVEPGPLGDDAAPSATEQLPRIEPADPALRPALEANDVDLALRYLTDLSVLVLVDSSPELVPVVAEAAAWANGTLIVLVEPGARPPAGLPDDAIVLEAPAALDSPIPALVGELAAAIDAGAPVEEAFRGLVATAGWEPAGE